MTVIPRRPAGPGLDPEGPSAFPRLGMALAHRMTSATIKLDNVTKTFDGRVLAVDGVTLDIAAGEFFSLLGPSGCGKTTSLRMIAGFELPGLRSRSCSPAATSPTCPCTSATWAWCSSPMRCSRIAPWPRTWPSVCACARCPSPTSQRRVKAALAQVALTGLEDRKPGQLSGGQQQRVALARALVVEPPVLLCDEPLGALDRKLRQQMQFELKELQKRLGVTLVFVTHDQEEALAMSDRIAVMNQRQGRAGGCPDRDLRAPAHALRRRLHRRDQHSGGGAAAPALCGRRRSAWCAADGARVPATVETANFSRWLDAVARPAPPMAAPCWCARRMPASARRVSPGDAVGSGLERPGRGGTSGGLTCRVRSASSPSARAPRDDIAALFAEHAPAGTKVILRGALDGLSDAEVDKLPAARTAATRSTRACAAAAT